MKALFTALLLAAIVFTQVTAPAQTSPVAQENSQKAKTLLDQMIAALGGQAYLNIQDMTQEGRSYTFHNGEPNSYGVQFWRFYRFPDKDRYEIGKKRDVIFIYNGDAGYETTYKGTRGGEPKELAVYLRKRHFALDRVLRTWLKEPGLAYFYEGSAVAADKPAEQISLLNAQNEGVTIYIDTSTHLPLKKSYTWRDPVDKEKNTEDEVYDNYRLVQGVMTPYRISTFYNGLMSGQRFLNNVSFNQGLSDSLFEATITYGPKSSVQKK